MKVNRVSLVVDTTQGNTMQVITELLEQHQNFDLMKLTVTNNAASATIISLETCLNTAEDSWPKLE